MLTDRPVIERDISPGLKDPGLTPGARNYKFSGIILGVIGAFLIYSIVPDSAGFDARVTAGIAVLMGIWWITEAAPLAATALVPLIAFPAFGTTSLSEIAPEYSSSIILLFLGGFMLALALQRWNLHKRIAINVVLLIGTKPRRLIAGFMIATGGLSMWVSNTATAMMMIPMGMTLVKMLEEQGVLPKKSKFGTGLLLSIAYGASIGGLGTMIGSPVNVVVVAYMRNTLEYNVTFLEWMMVGVPSVLIIGLIGYLIIAYVVWKPEIDEIPNGRQLFKDQLAALGPMVNGEKIVLTVFIATALSWIFVPMIAPEGFWLNDTAIALIAGVLVMLLPANPRKGVMVMNWRDTEEMPWGILLLIGGGLALSSQITGSGLSAWMGESLSGLGNAPLWVLILVLVTMLMFLTELTSTTATVAAFTPVVGGLAMAVGQDPVALVVAAAIACTCAFMLPVGTPPNALAFSTGAVTMNQKIKTGVWVSISCIVAVTLISYFWVPVIFSS